MCKFKAEFCSNKKIINRNLYLWKSWKLKWLEKLSLMTSWETWVSSINKVNLQTHITESSWGAGGLVSLGFRMTTRELCCRTSFQAQAPYERTKTSAKTSQQPVALRDLCLSLGLSLWSGEARRGSEMGQNAVRCEAGVWSH